MYSIVTQYAIVSSIKSRIMYTYGSLVHPFWFAVLFP